MPDSQQEKMDPAKKVRVPVPKGPKLISKEAWVRLLHLVFHFLGVKLEIVGASAGGKSGDKAGLQVKPGTGEEGEDEGGGYEPWDPPENEDCGCGTGPVLMAKQTFSCGRSTCCTLGFLPPEHPSAPGTYAKRVRTIDATMWDYTSGSLVTYPCVRIIETDNHVGGSGTAGGPCSEGTPSCGVPETTATGCDDAAQCSDFPEPGFKCWFIDEEENVYSKFCTDETQQSAAEAGAEETTDEEFTEAAVAAMIGAISAYDDGFYFRYRWEFKRVGRRKPTRLKITWTNSFEEEEETFEDLVEFLGTTDTGLYELAPVGGPGAVAEIEAVEVIYGKLP